MSFSFEFVATKADAVKIVDEEHAPGTVKQFLHLALMAFKDEEQVLVKAIGHLYNGDYDTSTATITVQRMQVRKPKPIVEKA